LQKLYLHNMSNVNLNKRIMRRVYMIYMLRTLINPITLKSFVLFGAAFAMASLISVTNVLENMPSIADISVFFSFTFSAFTGTEVLVQLLVVAVAAVGLWLVRDFVRAFSLPLARV